MTTAPDFSRDHFALFDLKPAFAIDVAVLDQRFRDMQAQVHPDKHVHLSEAEQRVSMQWATRANEAYRTLKSPLQRGLYLLQLRGVDPQVERNTSMPMEFLVQQLTCREAVTEARNAHEVSDLEVLHRELRADLKAEYLLLGDELDQKNDNEGAAQTVRRLMFKEKLLHEIDEAIEAIETSGD